MAVKVTLWYCGLRHYAVLWVRIDVSEEKHLAMEAVRFYKTTVTLTHKASTTAGSCVCNF